MTRAPEQRVVKIRLARPEDRDVIGKLHWPGRSRPAEWEWVLTAPEPEVAGVVLVAEAEERIVGCVYGLVVKEGDMVKGCIGSLTVEDKYRRKRAAVHMMDEMIRRMKELGARVFFTNPARNPLAFLELGEPLRFTRMSGRAFYRLVNGDVAEHE